MTHLTRSPILIVAIMLLAACDGTASPSPVTHTPAAAPAATAAALVKGEFAGDAGRLAGIGLSTNGRQVIAYLCNGTGQHVSLAQWFQGPVTSTGIDITNAHGAHLVATVSAHAIIGAVTLTDGRSAPFTARLIPDPGSGYGLVPQRGNLQRGALSGRLDLHSTAACQRPDGNGNTSLPDQRDGSDARLLPSQSRRRRHHQRADRGADRQPPCREHSQRDHTGPGHVPAHPVPRGSVLNRPGSRLPAEAGALRDSRRALKHTGRQEMACEPNTHRSAGLPAT